MAQNPDRITWYYSDYFANAAQALADLYQVRRQLDTPFEDWFYNLFMACDGLTLKNMTLYLVEQEEQNAS